MDGDTKDDIFAGTDHAVNEAVLGLLQLQIREAIPLDEVDVGLQHLCLAAL